MREIAEVQNISSSEILEAADSALWGSGALFDALPAGIYICNTDGQIVRFNSQAAELWGRRPSLGDTDE